MINLAGNKGYIAYNLRQRGIPEEEIEDLYQDCCVLYYSNPSNYKEEFGVVHIMDLLMRSVLFERNRYRNSKGRKSPIVSFDLIAHDIPISPKTEKNIDKERLSKILRKLLRIENPQVTIS